jgi:hypothetical protein
LPIRCGLDHNPAQIACRAERTNVPIPELPLPQLPLSAAPFSQAAVRGAARLARVVKTTTDVSLTALSARAHHGSLSNARTALFERQQRDLGSLHAWREVEPRLRRPEPAPAAPAGETA